MKKRKHRLKPGEADEKDVEVFFCRLCADEGWLALKLVALSRRGFPDRTVLGKDRRIFFAELKRDKKTPRKLQDLWRKLLEGFGFNVYVVKTHEEAARAIQSELYPETLAT